MPEREIEGRTIELSNLDKVLFPDAEVTKGDLIDYYGRIADRLLPHVEDRPLSLKRYPDGIDEQSWFQKDAPDYFPGWIRTGDLPRKRDDGTVHHVVAENAATLVYLANQACIELHVGPCPVGDLQHPVVLLFDLDPPPDAEVADVRRATRQVRDLLEDELGLSTYVKASGSKGFHVHVPLDGSGDVETVRGFARDAAELLAERHGGLTVEHRKDARRRRVFVDWLRNHPSQTAVAPYSLRARKGATVAIPLAWDELSEGVDPDRYHLGNVFRRLSQVDDPWAGYLDDRQSLDEARETLDELREQG